MCEEIKIIEFIKKHGILLEYGPYKIMKWGKELTTDKEKCWIVTSSYAQDRILLKTDDFNQAIKKLSDGWYK